MSKNNGQPQVSREEIQGFIDGFQMQLVDAEAELQAADQKLSDWKRAQVESQQQQAAANASPGTLPRAGFFFLENDEERQHMEYMRGRKVAKVADLQRRIKLLNKALALTPE